jgi:arginine repressor
MARTKSTEGRSKTDIVRDYLRSNPTATRSQIVADLKPYGISLALAQKTRYLERRKRRGAGPNRGRAKAEAAGTSAGRSAGTKADAIRDAAKTLPKPIRPRDVVAALAEKGVTVSNAQVGQVLKGMGMRRRRRGRRMVVETVASTLTLESLLAAKKLVNQLGSVGAAKHAVDALAKLS